MVSSWNAYDDRDHHGMHLMMDIIPHRLWNKVIPRNACDDRYHYPMRVMKWLAMTGINACDEWYQQDKGYHHATHVMTGVIIKWV